MDCIKCKMPLPDGSEFCCWCGKPQKEEKRAKKNPNGNGSVRKLSGNRKKPWTAQLPLSAGRQYIGYYATKREAIKALGDALSKTAALGEYYNYTVSDIYKAWSGTAFRDLSEKSVKAYEQAYKKLSLVYDKKMRDIRAADIQYIIDENAEHSEACYKIKVLYSQLCRFAMSIDLINQNYSQFLKLPKGEKSEKKIFTPEHIKRLFARADTNDTAKAVLILIYSGMRVGELIDMRIKNVDIRNEYMIGGNKTEAGKNRLFPFHNAVSEYIKYFYIKNREYGYLITSPERKKMSYKNFRDRYFKPLLKEIGADGLTFHSARHTFATLGQAAGIAPEDMIRLIGHTNYKTTTENYIHQNLEKLRSAINKIK